MRVILCFLLALALFGTSRAAQALPVMPPAPVCVPLPAGAACGGPLCGAVDSGPCGPGFYFLGNANDVDALLYFGLHRNGNAPGTAVACNSDARRALLATWAAMFVPAGNSPLLYALRQSTAGVGPLVAAMAGTTFAHPPATAATFCNGDDFQDIDPIRVTCPANTDVCSRDGTLGLVIPIDVPAFPFPYYNAGGAPQLCAVGRFRLLNPVLPPGFRCPNEMGPLIGKCFQPLFTSPTIGDDAECVARRTPVQGFAGGGMDGRAYNRFFKNATGKYLSPVVSGRYVHHLLKVSACTSPVTGAQVACLKASLPTYSF